MEILGHDSLNTVWVEATPMGSVFEDDHGSLGVAETLSEYKSLLVRSDVPLHELNLSFIEKALREDATVARGGSDNSDQ